MRGFHVYRPPTEWDTGHPQELEVVKQGPCWTALVLGPLWAVARGLAVIGCLGAVVTVIAWIMPMPSSYAITWMIVFHLFLCIFGNKCREDALEHKGYEYIADAMAMDEPPKDTENKDDDET